VEHFLTERYCLFTRGRDGKILRVDVHHEPWPLQPGRAEVDAADLLRPFDLILPECVPHLLFSSGVRVVSWPACVVGHEMEAVSAGSGLRPAMGMDVPSAAKAFLVKTQPPGCKLPE
jgi:hypothetical protein